MQRSENGQMPPTGLQERSLAHPWIEYQKHEREDQKDTKPRKLLSSGLCMADNGCMQDATYHHPY